MVKLRSGFTVTGGGVTGAAAPVRGVAENAEGGWSEGGCPPLVPRPPTRYTVPMRIPITGYGLPQVAVFPALVLALGAGLFVLLPAGWPLAVLAAVLAAVLIWVLSFFRDPQRRVPADEFVLLSPADGRITDVAEVDCPEVGGAALRIGMFLSVFNVHVNRMPCSVKVDAVVYKKGRFKNAMAGDAWQVNEANDIIVTRLCEPKVPLLLRQVSGAVARHIVCRARLGDEFAQGQRFGMIKFGSRAELYLPLQGGGFDIAVKVGERVKAGISPLAVFRRQS